MPIRRSTIIALAVALPSIAHAAGVAARFAPLRAVAGEALEVRIEIDDQIGAVARVVVELEAAGNIHTAHAAREGSTWRARYPASVLPEPPAEIALSAEILGARGGLLLRLGDPEPLVLRVMTREGAKVEVEALRLATEEARPRAFAGLVGVEARAGTGARARAAVGIAAPLAEQLELDVVVSVGPAFSRPSTLSEGGPVVLGFDAALRGYAAGPFGDPFVEIYGATDVRLPGVDPGAGLRAGLSLPVAALLRAEASIGGGVIVFDATGAREVGAGGALRLTLRIGGPPRVAP